MTKQPASWWFAIPLPAALLISLAIWLVRGWFISNSPSNFLQNATIISIVGALCFPIGLPNAVGCPQDIMNNCLLVFVSGGYLLYIALSIVGMRRPTLAILLVLTTLLILNMVGCQMENRAIDFND
ncbi:MAG: hypothetical protein WCN95_07370 [bacterium]